MRIINSLLLFLLCTGWLLGQRQAVEGTVISSEDGFPLIGVSVLLKGTTLGTITDIDGYYQLQTCLLYTSPSPRDKRQSRMPSSA